MSDSNQLLRKLGLDRPEAVVSPAGAPRSSAAEEEEECAAFGYLRGVRDRALHVEFRLANGNTEAFPYAWLGPVRYNPSAGVVLDFVGDRTYRVEIHGRNLDTLIGGSINLIDRGLLRHRVLWVREMDRGEVRRLPDAAMVVEAILIRTVRPGDEP